MMILFIRLAKAGADLEGRVVVVQHQLQCCRIVLPHYEGLLKVDILQHNASFSKSLPGCGQSHFDICRRRIHHGTLNAVIAQKVKVLGASVTQIARLLCKEFFILVIVANVIAWPAAYFIMRKWLQSYAYRTDLGFFVFIGAMLLALFVAILSVSYQAIRAARANPADSLRYE